MGGVGVMVGVRVARREGVSVGPEMVGRPGVGLGVTVGLYARGVKLSPSMAAVASGVKEAEPLAGLAWLLERDGTGSPAIDVGSAMDVSVPAGTGSASGLRGNVEQLNPTSSKTNPVRMT